MRDNILPISASVAAFRRRHTPFQFCAVCRYVLVDRIDPSQHGALDVEYGKQYPDP
jgi:hypothetical protein